MLTPAYHKSFERDLKKAKKRKMDIEKLKSVMTALINEKALPAKHRNHKLKGNFVGYWECHVESDWLLIYKKDSDHIYFVRTGSHSDLF